MRISGWGKFPVINAQVSTPRDLDSVFEAVKKGQAIARGNGRSYGDSSISINNTINLTALNRILSFDNKTGILVAQSGVLLADILEIFLPKGWFPKVTPGTKYVTLGGMAAADIHGKNHHKDGSFRSCVKWIDLVTKEGELKRCSPENNTELFNWTIGGMGLTGIIVTIAIQLRPVSSAWIKEKTLSARNIKEAINIFEQSQEATYSVGWIDCLSKGKNLGRSLIMLGEHADPSDLPDQFHQTPFKNRIRKKISIPIHFPSFILNRISVRLFNLLYYIRGRRKHSENLVGWDEYFYPLDSLLGWNKIYGRKGFVQFQCVIPLEQSEEGITRLLKVISERGVASFLAVLKRFGKQDSPISFPMEGYTLALDFPISKKTLALLDELDEITLQYGGRFYLAKDSRMTAETFSKSETRLKKFIAFRTKARHSDKFASVQSKRLGL